MSFHSTQATSQALQPMQVVVSISLHTVSCRCIPLPGTGPGWPEICWICNVVRSPIVRLLGFLQLDEEALELRRVSIGIDNRRGQQVHGGLRSSVYVLGNTQEAPVDRYANLIGLLAVHIHSLDSLRDHRLGNILA